MQPIVTYVLFDRLRGETVRFEPEGDVDEWEIGQPHIPYEILESVSPGSVLERMQIEFVGLHSWNEGRELGCLNIEADLPMR